MVTLYLHGDGLAHLTPPGHPERAERLVAIKAALEPLGLPLGICPMGREEDVLRAHSAAHLGRVMQPVAPGRRVMLDGDTVLSPGSGAAALRAVGMACAALDAVMATGGRAFVAARPPGHHAERGQAMGFCLLGTVAIAALRALAVHGLSRVAVLDFDVHHGNGTQDILWEEPRVRFVSSHQMPLYPGTGSRDERGAHGQITNLPLRPGSGGAAMRAAWGPVLAELALWQPELIVISAGFDAHSDDPLGGLDWQVEDFRWLTAAIRDLADGACAGRVVSCLEGGYDLGALAASVVAHVEELGDPAIGKAEA